MYKYVLIHIFTCKKNEKEYKSRFQSKKQPKY
jgi:hypothetical protein